LKHGSILSDIFPQSRVSSQCKSTATVNAETGFDLSDTLNEDLAVNLVEAVRTSEEFQVTDLSAFRESLRSKLKLSGDRS